MRKGVLAGAIIAAGALVSAIAWAKQYKKEIVGLTPEQVNWFTPPYYTDGRQRARLVGDSSQGGAWIERAHTHPHDELVTVIEGTWYLGQGERFDTAKLKAYPAGSFIVIPAGVPHFVAAKDGIVVVQLRIALMCRSILRSGRA